MSYECLPYYRCNINEETGVHYGVISIHDVDPFFLDDIYMNGIDNIYEVYRLDLQEQGLSEEEIEQELECYDSGCYTDIYYEDDKYRLQLNENYLIVLFSPRVINCRLCSPCFPNAGDLDAEDNDYGVETYALMECDMRDDEW